MNSFLRLVLGFTAVSALADTAVAQSSAPHVYAVLKPAAGIYHPGNKLSFALEFHTDSPLHWTSGSSDGTGLPRLVLHIGSQTRYAPIAWYAMYKNKLGFEYQLTAADVPADGITIEPAIDFNGGSITVGSTSIDPSLDNADIQASGGLDGSGVKIAVYPNTAPNIVPISLTGTSAGELDFAYEPITNVPIAGNFTVTGLPASITTTSGRILHFDVDYFQNPPPVTGSGTIQGGSVSAPVKVQAVRTTNPEYLADGSEVAAVGVPPAGVYHAGDTLTFAVSYASDISVTGTPIFPITIGGRARTATYVPTPAASTMAFVYTVAADDSGALTLGHGFTGTCLVHGNYMLGEQAHTWLFIPDTSGILVGSAPIASSSIQVGSAVVGGDTLKSFFYSIAATNTDAATVTYDVLGLPPALEVDHRGGSISGTVQASGDYNGTIVVSDKTGTATAPILFRFRASGTPPTIYSPDNFDRNFYHDNPSQPEDHIYLSATGSPTWSGTTSWGTSGTITSYGEVYVPIQFPGTYTADVTATNSFGSDSQHITVRVHPAVTDVIPSQPNVYHVGETFTLTVRCNAVMTVTGTPAINLFYLKNIGVRKARYISGSGTTALVFGYTVAANDPTGDFDINVSNPFDTSTGTITSGGLTLTNYLPLRYFQKPLSIDTSQPPPAPPPPTPSKADQTITFSSPVSAIIVGQPVALGATSSAGLPITYSVVSGNATVSGNTLTPTSTTPLVVRASSAGNDQVNAASVDVDFGDPQKAAQTITASSTLRSVNAGTSVTLDATSSAGLPIAYTLLSGPATLSGNTLTITGTSGTVFVRASQPGDANTNVANDLTLQFTIGPVPTSRLVNISSRLRVSANDANGASIAGFVVTGSSPKPILIRAVGPSLSTFGIGSPLAAPQLKLFDPKNVVVATNAGWVNDAQIAATGTAVGAFPLGAGSKDAALLVTLAPGAYTTQVQSPSSGTALIEVYDAAANASSPTKQLINISTRGTVGTGDDVLIGGFVVSGDQPKRVLIRGIGPALAGFGVSGTLADPILTVYDSKQIVVATNDNWGTPQPLTPSQPLGADADIAAAGTAAGAFALQPGSADAAVLITLNPGGYSAVVTGANNGGGAAMVEIYEVPE